MIIYKIDIIKKLKEKGYTQYYLRKNELIGAETLTNIKTGKMISLKTLDIICKLTGCKVGDLIKYEKDK